MGKDYHEKLTEIKVRFPSEDVTRGIPDYAAIIRNRAKELGFVQPKGKTKGEGNINAYILDLIEKDIKSANSNFSIERSLLNKQEDRRGDNPMVEIGDKFVVEIRDIAVVPDKNGNEKQMYYIKGFNSLVFDEYGLEQLEKPTDYEDGFRDAWNALGDIVLARALTLRTEES